MAGAAQSDELAALRGEVARLRALIEPPGRPKRLARPRRRAPGRLAAALLTALLALVPLGTLAVSPFNDLNPGSPHNQNIEAIYDAGITRGCDPGVSYCPNGTVTREEMASFLARAAGLGANPPVANAKTAISAQTAVSAQTATSATSAASATNADKVDGFDANGLMRVARSQGSIDPVRVDVAFPTWTTALTVKITAPGPGFVLVNSSVTLQGESALGCVLSSLFYDCAIDMRLYDPAGRLESPFVTVATYDVLPYGTAAATYVFPVAAAGEHSYTMDVRREGDDRPFSFLSPQMTALYVPFGSTGAGSLGVPDPSPNPDRRRR